MNECKHHPSWIFNICFSDNWPTFSNRRAAFFLSLFFFVSFLKITAFTVIRLFIFLLTNGPDFREFASSRGQLSFWRRTFCPRLLIFHRYSSNIDCSTKIGEQERERERGKEGGRRREGSGLARPIYLLIKIFLLYCSFSLSLHGDSRSTRKWEALTPKPTLRLL